MHIVIIIFHVLFFLQKYIRCEYVSLLDEDASLHKLSKIHFFDNDMYNYDLCKFSNACYNNNEILIYVKNDAKNLNNIFNMCCIKKKSCKGIDSRICKC